MSDGPDFLCVGMHKGGTRWLFDQLQYHPDFWMPPLKELHYFDRGDSVGKNAQQALDFARGRSNRKKTQRNTSREWDERDFGFLEEMAGASGSAPDVERYARMFKHKGHLRSGDITPHYCNLKEATVAEITGRFPYAVVLLLVRDPVKRAWSHICQIARSGGFHESLLGRPAEFRSFLHGAKKINQLSYASRGHVLWQRYVKDKQYRFFFMDDIAAKAADVREQILVLLGADPAKPSGEIPADYNPKAKGRKLDLSEPIKAVLVEHFTQELRECAALFGGHAEKWADEYGV